MLSRSTSYFLVITQIDIASDIIGKQKLLKQGQEVRTKKKKKKQEELTNKLHESLKAEKGICFC